MRGRTFISFDWALKRLLRQKANFDVLEGFLTTVLNTEVKIKKLLESEGNKNRDDAKYNRVDLLAEDSNGELLLIEVQGEPEFAYFQRMLFGASKLVTEYVESGENYEHVRKVYSINIVYFDLGQGNDVVYIGKTEFRGVHSGDVLQLSPYMQQKFKADAVSQLFPMYVILKVNDFNRWSKVPLDQWMYFLGTSDIPEDASAPGLQTAREKLRFMQMSREEQADYDRYLMGRAILRNTMVTARDEGYDQGREEGLAEGLAEGRAEGLVKGRAEGLVKGREEGLVKGREEGLAKGREEGREEGLVKGREEGLAEGAMSKALDIARRLIAQGLPVETVLQATGLTEADLSHL